MQPQNKEFHRVVSTAIVHKDGKYLILRRALNKKMFPGRWTLPGGGLTVDDYALAPKTTPDAWYFVVANSLRREVKEETSLDVDQFNYLFDLAFIRPDGVPVITLSYWGNWKSGEVKLNNENIDYKWVTLEEAKNYDLIEGLLEEMAMADRIIRGENPYEVRFAFNNN
jgi:8-oxo-dGTP pyrophosphatase MutT (NUDIX family)